MSKSPFRPVVDFVVFTNIWIALGAVAIYLSSYALLGYFEQESRLIDYNSLKTETLLVFFATMAGYNLLRLQALRKDQEIEADKPFLNWVKEKKTTLFYMTGMAIIAGSTMLAFVSKSMVIVMVIAGVMGVLYGLPLFPKDGKKRKLRDLGYNKTFLVALVWMLVVAVIPALHMKAAALPFVFICLESFLLILGLTIPFDIRDMEYDKEDGLVTFPLKYGVEGAKRFATVVLAAAGIVYFLHILMIPKFRPEWIAMVYPQNIISFVWVFAILYLTRNYVKKLTEDNSEYSYTFALDGVLIVLGFGLVAIRFIT